MNEFVEQFLVEARELVEQATRDLLALEERPGDAERLDGAFRAFHTLKGAAGIVDFAAMARALHAAEDVLAGVRAGADPATPRLVGDCLSCLDQVAAWLDAMEADGEPPADAETRADAVVRRFAKDGDPAPRPAAAPLDDRWPETLAARHPAVAGARTALRYRPDSDCFFRGEDPLAVLAGLPGVLALEIASAGAKRPTLDALDPFACELVFQALISATPEETARHTAQQRDQVDVRALGTAFDGTGPALSPPARALLEAQIQLLAEGEPEGSAGRLASAARVAANVLRSEGEAALAGELDRLLAGSQAAGDARAFAAAIEGALRGDLRSDPDPAEAAARIPNEPAARALRVDVERIDALVKLTGELTVVKNALGHAAQLARDGAETDSLATVLKDRQAVLDRLVGELQRAILSVRVLPLRRVFQRFPRLVREMAAGVGKGARLVTEGDDTEADKAVVEALFEPLLHVLRNAVDHGLEDAEERAAAGKPSMATIWLRAFRQGEHVVVEVEDDGAGMDVERIRQVAARRGVAPADRLAAMADTDVIELIFAPGFSTASEITGLSGRGVGMDAVRTAIERLGGTVSIDSRPGRGTRARFTMPFAVMVTRVMTVEAGGQVFGIPLDAVVETVRIARDRVVPVGAACAFVLRNRTIPLIDLAEALGRERQQAPGAHATVVVGVTGGQLGGIEVERLGEPMDIMLQPLDGLLAGTSGVAGTSLLGDGRVLVVLDLQELLR